MGNKQITNKAYDESDTRTGRKYCDTWRSLGRGTTLLKYRSKRKPPVESRMTKQQTRLSPVPTTLNESTSFMLDPSFTDTRPTGVQFKEGSEVINRNWVNNLTCRRWHYIYIISNTFVTYDNFNELIRKINPTYKKSIIFWRR